MHNINTIHLQYTTTQIVYSVLCTIIKNMRVLIKFSKKNIITFSRYFPGQAVSVNGLMADLFVLSDFRIISFH